MAQLHSIARNAYWLTAFAAFPGLLWSGFEMYVLTLGGSQMLFFSIVHTAPFLVIVVLIGVLAALLWIIESAIALLVARYQSKLLIPRIGLASMAALVTLHLALLYTYEWWSAGSMRIVICLFGIAAGLYLLVLCAKYLWDSLDLEAEL